MANILRFVDINKTTGVVTNRLTLDYVEGETILPMSANTKVWAGNITAPGASLITRKDEMIDIVLALHVHTVSRATLDTALRAIVTEITRKNILEFQPQGGSAIYYTTYPYDTAEAAHLMEQVYRDAFVVHPFRFTLKADPYAWGAEQTITVVDNLILNWDMETFTAPNIPDGWTVTVAGGGSTVAEDNTGGDFIFGTSSVSLLTTAAGSSAQIETTAAIAIDHTKHYCIVFNYQCEVGTLDMLTCILTPDAGAAVTLTPTVAAVDTWYSYTAVIHPTGGGGNEWNVAATTVKIAFKLTGAAANPTEYNVDGIVFSCTEYTTNKKLTDPLGIVIPASDILGDVPSYCDFYLSRFSDPGAIEFYSYFIGGRKEYSVDYNPNMEMTIDDYSAFCGTNDNETSERGSYKSDAIGGAGTYTSANQTLLLDSIRGYVLPYIHFDLGANRNDVAVTLEGIPDVGLGTYLTLCTAEIDFHSHWIWLSLPACNIPGLASSDFADTSAMDYFVRIKLVLAEANDINFDHFSLMPIDNGFGYCYAGDQHSIFDSSSEVARVLWSDDGTIHNAFWNQWGVIHKPFTLNPQDGSNFAIHATNEDVAALDDQHRQFQNDVIIKYRPRYLLVA